MIDVRGIVPLWCALERQADQATHTVQRSWFREDDPPYRRGVGVRVRLPERSGWRVRIGSTALHFGLMRHSGAKSHVDVLGRELDLTPPDLQEWRRPGDSGPRVAP